MMNLTECRGEQSPSHGCREHGRLGIRLPLAAHMPSHISGEGVLSARDGTTARTAPSDSEEESEPWASNPVILPHNCGFLCSIQV